MNLLSHLNSITMGVLFTLCTLSLFGGEGVKKEESAIQKPVTQVTLALTEEENAIVRELGISFVKSFLANDPKAFQALLVPKSSVEKIIAPKYLKGERPVTHKLIVDSNLKRFEDWRKVFADVSLFNTENAVVQPGTPLDSQADFYTQPKSVLKNTFVTFAYANRITVKLKLEEIVLVDGKCYIVKVD